ncbi:MAG TPA: hypothetical protein VM598_04280 [Bdellovibrionota bacterium]|nr:hypothetical protein [Bdellovibrionota bacterium]
MAENEMQSKDKLEDVNKPQSQDIDKDIDQGNVEKFPGKQQDIKQQDIGQDPGLKTEDENKKDEDIPEKEAV